ncbi:bifunctional sterol desaturase/short chain dehydrogenase [Leptolyngbya sp. FACHB-261]|uniref:bifunctional sterol desaturase/short chain dehydrogenase n=1 Tax=Leptolyngbya sp. FACHB-261 TaxID=2692806 RepID=UPI001F55A5F1|nr:bifunctional sterol desaturase/short chain dehydrogenase [Leptolyngbya sp. FACHB-261]
MIWSIIWAFGSVLGAEITRDLYHLIAHLNPVLMRWHGWHHRVYRRDLTVIDPMVYRQAQWRHDVPESLVMLTVTALVWWSSSFWAPNGQAALLLGVLYSVAFLVSGMARGVGWALETDLTHKSGPFLKPPSCWVVNRPYHWRHHFDDGNAYFCGTFTFVDKLMGTGLTLKGKTIAVTGASGTLGKALLQQLRQEGARVLALSSQAQPITIQVNGAEQSVETITWQVGQEEALATRLEKVDILILNHGINVLGERSATAIQKSYEVNTFSTWRLLELFLKTVRTSTDVALKEVWINTSEAEVSPALSPLYELSKRAIGDLVTLRRLDSPCVIRKLILGPFKSNLNPYGVMSGGWVARQIVALAKRDVRNIIVTVNPLTYLLFPWKEFWVSTYFRWFSRPTSDLEAEQATSLDSTNDSSKVDTAIGLK